ncbi:hypothetical protein ACQB6R_00395 [Propionibacteriaceae bacterium G1746]|uniref:hypothetical protein n=1 Tax=Aestuariimicrobium sp. G57 TaxID=3418485 RepID=UPI003C1B9879
MAQRSWWRTLISALLVMAIPAALVLLLRTNPRADNPVAVPVAAVVDHDRPQTVGGSSVGLGRDLVARLLAASDVKWVQVTAADAKAGVQSGRYAAVATVPEDFTAATLAVAGGKQAQINVSVISSPMAPSSESLIGRSVARATNQTVGTSVAGAAMDSVYLTFTDADEAFRTAQDRAKNLATRTGDAETQQKSAADAGAAVTGMLGTLGQQRSGLGKGPGLPDASGSQQQSAAANQQLNQQGALTAEAQAALARAAAASADAKTSGAASKSTIDALDALAKQIDQQASTQQQGVNTYTNSVAAAAERQRGIDASLKGIKTQLASFSDQLGQIAGTSSAQRQGVAPSSLRKTSTDSAADLAAALASLQGLVNQLETDQTVSTAQALAVQLKDFADGADGNVGDLESRLKAIRKKYDNAGVGQQLPVACPYPDAPGGGLSEQCRAWRAGVVDGLDIALDELSQTDLGARSAKLRELAQQNLDNVNAISTTRADLLTSARAAAVALQRAIDNGAGSAPEVIEKVSKVAQSAKSLSTSAQGLSQESEQQSAALQAIDKDSPAVKQLDDSAAALNQTLQQQGAQLSGLTQTVAGLSQQLDGLTETVASLTQQNTELQQTGTSLQATLNQLERNSAELNRQLGAAKSAINQQDQKLAQIDKQIADAEAAGKVLTTQLQQLQQQGQQLNTQAQGNAKQFEDPNAWPQLDPSTRQKVTSLLELPVTPDVDHREAVNWTAMAILVAIWVGALAGVGVIDRARGHVRANPDGQDVTMPGADGRLRMALRSVVVEVGVVAALVGGTVFAVVAPAAAGHRSDLAAMVFVGSVAAAALAMAARRFLGATVGVWVVLGLLATTLMGMSAAAPQWLEFIRDTTAATPLFDGLRIALAGGEGTSARVGTLLVWAVCSVLVATLAALRYRRAKD